jgi:hypothetical protein
MKHIKGASQAPTQLVLRNLGIQSQEIHKRKDSRLFSKKKKIKKKKSKGRKLGYTAKGNKSNKKRKK